MNVSEAERLPMNQKQLAQKVAEKLNENKKKMEQIINSALEFIMDEVKEGKKVRLVGFGHFSMHTRKGRVGRNPRTGEPLNLPETKSPFFTPGFHFKKAVKSR